LGVWLVALVLALAASWDAFTTFIGVAEFFDLAMAAKINPAQFTFALIVTVVVFGFVISSHLIFSFKSDDVTILLLKIAWFLCLVIDLYTSWLGTKRYVFYDDASEPGRYAGLVLVTFLIVASSVLLSKLLLAKDIRGKPFLF
jgi:hypothetical protein